MQMGTGETLIKQYDYANTNTGNFDSFVLTDRRAIAVRKTKLGEARDEIRVKDVTSVESSYKHKKKLNMIGLVIALIGLAMFIAGCAAGMVALILIGLVALVGGVFIMIKLGKHYKEFFLVLTTDCYKGNSISASATTGFGVVKTKKSFFSKLFKFKRKVKIRIDETVAYEMMEEVSSKIFELQAKA